MNLFETLLALLGENKINLADCSAFQIPENVVYREGRQHWESLTLDFRVLSSWMEAPSTNYEIVAIDAYGAGPHSFAEPNWRGLVEMKGVFGIFHLAQIADGSGGYVRDFWIIVIPLASIGKPSQP